MPTERGEVDVAGSRIDARLVWIEDAAGVAAYSTRSLSARFGRHRASIVAAVARTGIRAAMVRIADEAARPGSRCGHASGRLIDRRRIAGSVQPAVEIIKAER